MLANQSSAIIAGIIGKRCDLHQIERKVFFETLTPALDHRFQQDSIRIRMIAVGFALIPDSTGQGIRHDRTDHLIIQYTRLYGPPGICFIGHYITYAGIIHYLFFGHPYLSRSTSPGRHDQADRDIQVFLQVTSKEVSYSAGTLHLVRGTGGPRCFAIILRGSGPAFGDMEETDIRIIGGGDLFFTVVDTVHRSPFHIGLAATQPYFAQHDVFQFTGAIAQDR